jgi:hypothetical protein
MDVTKIDKVMFIKCNRVLPNMRLAPCFILVLFVPVAKAQTNITLLTGYVIHSTNNIYQSRPGPTHHCVKSHPLQHLINLGMPCNDDACPNSPSYSFFVSLHEE